MEHVGQVLDVKAVEAQMLATHQTLEGFIKKSEQEIKAACSVSVEAKAAVDKLAEQATRLGDKIAELEQKQAKHFEPEPARKSIGDTVVDSDEFKTLLQRKSGQARVEFKTTIVNDYTLGMAQPLVAGDRLNMVWHEPNRPLRIRDVIPQGRTSSDVIWFPKENVLVEQLALAA